MASAVKIASTSIGAGSGAVGPPAPNVLNLQAGQRQSNGVYLPTFYADPLGQAMMFDWQADLPADTSNFGGIQIVLQIPSGAGVYDYHKVLDLIPWSASGATSQFKPGLKYTYSVTGNLPSTPESWTVIAQSINATGQLNVDGNGNPAGPSVELTTILPPLPQPSAAQFSVSLYGNAHDPSSGQNISQIQCAITLNDPRIETFDIWQYIGAAPPTDASQYVNVATVAEAASGTTTAIWNVMRQSSAITLQIAVVAASQSFYRAPTTDDPVHSITVSPISMPSQVTAFNVSFTTNWVGGVFTGFLTYSFAIPNDPEIAWVNVMRVQCDDPALHAGAYVPMAGKSFGDVYDVGVTTAQLGTSVSYTVTMPLDPANNAPSWWTFKVESSSRAGLRNTASDPTFNLAATAVSKLDTSQLATPIQSGQLASQIINSLSLFPNSIRPLAIVTSLPTLPDANYPIGAVVYLNDGVNNKLYRNIANSWSAGTAAADITAGTLAFGVAYGGAIAINQLTAGTMSITGAAVFQNSISTAYVAINGAGVSIAGASAGTSVAITSSGILCQQGATGPYVQITATGVQLVHSATGCSLTLGSSSITLSAYNGASLTLTATQIQFYTSTGMAIITNYGAAGVTLSTSSGPLVLGGAGGVLIANGTSLTLTPGSVYANSFYTNSVSGNWSMTSGVVPSLSNVAASINVLSYQVVGTTVINSSGTFVGAGADVGMNGVAARAFNPRNSGGTLYTGQDFTLGFNSATGKLQRNGVDINTLVFVGGALATWS